MNRVLCDNCNVRLDTDYDIRSMADPTPIEVTREGDPERHFCGWQCLFLYTQRKLPRL